SIASARRQQGRTFDCYQPSRRQRSAGPGVGNSRTGRAGTNTDGPLMFGIKWSRKRPHPDSESVWEERCNRSRGQIRAHARCKKVLAEWSAGRLALSGPWRRLAEPDAKKKSRVSNMDYQVSHLGLIDVKESR